MSGINLNASEGKNIFSPSIWNRNEGNKIVEQLGNIISATVTNKTDSELTLKTRDDIIFQADSSKVLGEVGEELYFQVVGSGKNGVALKQIDNPFIKVLNESNRPQSGANIKELFQRSNFIKEENIFKNDSANDEQLKEAQALAKIKRDLAFGYNNINENAVAELLKQGISLDKIDLGMMTEAIKEIKTAHPLIQTENRYMASAETHPEAHSKLHSDKQQSQSPARRHARQNEKDYSRIENGIQKEGLEKEGSENNSNFIEKFLIDNDLPVTDDNIKSMESVIDKFSKIKSTDDSTIKKLLRDDKELTLKNVYISRFTATEAGNAVKPLGEGDLERLMAEVEKIFRRDNVEMTPENLDTAEYLLKNELPVTKANVEKVLFLKKIDKNVTLEDLLQKAAENIKSRKNTLDITLNEPLKYDLTTARGLAKKYDEMIKFIPSIRLETVELLLKKQTPMTLDNLRAVWRPQDDKLAKNAEHSASGQDTTVTTVTARRQLYEIQLRLTSEAAYRLAGKNIDINTMPLKEALENLRNMENEMFTGNLRIMGAETSEKNISMMSALYGKLSEINPFMDRAYGDIITSKVDFSITGVHKAAVSARQAAGYEIFETVPSLKYGDTFSHVREQMGPLLEQLDIDSNEENIRAGIILSKNSIDISKEDISAIKNIDEKVTNILNRLHPNIAAAMIRDGLNPAEMRLDDVSGYINSYQNEYGDNLRDKLPELIAQLDASKNLTTGERESVMAIYRMLNAIERDGGVGIGTAYANSSKKETGSSLGDIFEAAKYYKRTQGKATDKDYTVDDTFGRLKELKGDENNVLKILDRLKETFKAPSDAIEYMVRNEVPTTPQNIQTVRQMLNDKFFVGRRLSDLDTDLRDLESKVKKSGLTDSEQTDSLLEDTEIMDTELTQLKDGVSPEDILSRLSNKLEQVSERYDSAKIIEQIRLLQNAVKVQNYAQRAGGNEIHLPIRLHGKISQLNMYIANEDLTRKDLTRNDSTKNDFAEKGLSVLMALDTPAFGEISADLNIESGGVTISIDAGNNPSAAERLNAGLAELSGRLSAGSGTKMQMLASVVSDVLKYIEEAGRGVVIA